MATKRDYAEAIPASGWEDREATSSQAPAFGTVRISRVVHEHHPITRGGKLTVGQMVDEHIAAVVKDGGLVSEIALIFETAEQQYELASLYRR